MGEVEFAVGVIIVFAEEVSPGLADPLAATVGVEIIWLAGVMAYGDWLGILTSYSENPSST